MESVKAAIAGGYTSVMIDGSSQPLEENMELTREVVKYAHPRGVSVEGELACSPASEDHVFAPRAPTPTRSRPVEFVRNTKVDALAISYGTMHGPIQGQGRQAPPRDPHRHPRVPLSRGARLPRS